MDYTYQPKSSSKRMVAVVTVVVFHLLVVYALMTGLDKKLIKVAEKITEAKIVDLPPPPPPPPPPPTVAPPYVPPVEVAVQAPAAPTITTTSEPPVNKEIVIAPPAPVAPAPPPPAPPAPPPRPPVTTISRLPGGCSPEIPQREMNKAGIERVEGSVLATVNPDSSVSNIRVKDASPGSMRNPVQRAFQASLTSGGCKIQSNGDKFEVEIPYTFKLE
jgi:periplasmic protein TonB